MEGTFGQFAAAVLELDELVVDLLDVDVAPKDLVVGGDTVDDVVVEPVEFLQQIELFADAVEAGQRRHRQAEQLGTALVRRLAAPQGVEAVLEHGQPVGGLARRQSVDHRPVGLVVDAEGVRIHAELAQVLQQLLLENGLHPHQLQVVFQRPLLQPLP